MTDQELEKLNRKLAEWRFPLPEFRVVKVYPDFIAIDGRYSKGAKEYLKRKGIVEDDWYRYKNIEILTQSLDAIFEHLMLEAANVLMDREDIEVEEAYQRLFALWLRESTYHEPALALCLAIEKVVDGGGVNDIKEH